MPLYFLIDKNNIVLAYDRMDSKRANFLNKKTIKKGKRWVTSEKIVEEYLSREDMTK